jgi:hypothetical protein
LRTLLLNNIILLIMRKISITNITKRSLRKCIVKSPKSKTTGLKILLMLLNSQKFITKISLRLLMKSSIGSLYTERSNHSLIFLRSKIIGQRILLLLLTSQEEITIAKSEELIMSSSNKRNQSLRYSLKEFYLNQGSNTSQYANKSRNPLRMKSIMMSVNLEPNIRDTSSSIK